MKTAIVHDWLVTYAGAEKALEQIIQLYPEADIYSLIDFLPEREREFILNKKVHTSFIQGIPFAKSKYRSYLPLFPLAIEQFDLSRYEIVISSSFSVAKGVLTTASQIHVCYCYSPIRYAWDLYHHYLKESGLDRGLRSNIARSILHYIRLWDVTTAHRADYFVAISDYIAKRIKKIYGRESTVIYPPVYTDMFELYSKKEDFYITVSRMVPYKKIDIIAEAFSTMPDKRLVVIGDGPDFGKIKSKAGKNIELLGHQPAEVLKNYIQKAKAFVFAAEEDFGIAPVEAQACGTPVIAFGRGGVLETVIEGETGLFFREQTVDSLIKAVKDFERKEDGFDCIKIRKNAERFSKERFRMEFKGFMERACRS